MVAGHRAVWAWGGAVDRFTVTACRMKRQCWRRQPERHLVRSRHRAVNTARSARPPARLASVATQSLHDDYPGRHTAALPQGRSGIDKSRCIHHHCTMRGSTPCWSTCRRDRQAGSDAPASEAIMRSRTAPAPCKRQISIRPQGPGRVTTSRAPRSGLRTRWRV
jgi:hypothetical protein